VHADAGGKQSHPLVHHAGLGTVALVLFTATVVLGILSTTRVATTNWPRFALTDLHRRISMIASSSWGSTCDHRARLVRLGQPHLVVVPFTSHYKPLWWASGRSRSTCCSP